MYNFILLLHLLGATLWTGGHLVLSLAILPRAMRNKNPNLILEFESGYEKIGIPALIVQIVTGLWLAQRLIPDMTHWFNADDTTSRLILVKLSLLIMTILFAAHARLRIIPGLVAEKLNSLAFHIIAVTILSVLFVATGLGFRPGVSF
jgi:putative copper export protein